MKYDIIFIMDLTKLNWNLHEYITYKQVSIYLFVGSLTHLITYSYIHNIHLHTYIQTYRDTYINT